MNNIILVLFSIIILFIILINVEDIKKMKKKNYLSKNYIYLEQLEKFSNNFMNHLTNKYLLNKNILNKTKKKCIIKLINIWNKNRLHENFNINNKTQTSFTKNKGKYIKMCLQNKYNYSNSKFLNMLKHVLLHEMAHIICYSYGHTKEFNIKFKFLIEEAKLAKLHNPINYKIYKSKYCGINVKYNPYFDYNLPNLQ